jgi:Fe-S cluster assembly protein SufD
MTKPIENAVVKSFIDLYIANMELITEGVSMAVNNARADAIEDFLLNGIPNTKYEKYKYTDIHALFAKDYEKYFASQNISVAQADLFRCDVPNLNAHLAMVVNGFYFGEPLTVLPNGAVFGSFAAASKSYPELFEKYYNKAADNAGEGLTALNTAFAQDGFFVYVPKGVILDKPIQVVNVLVSNEDIMVQPRNLFIVEDNAEAKMAICDHTLSTNGFLSNSVTEVFLGKNAGAEVVKVQNENNQSANISNVYAVQEALSRYNANAVTLHGGLVRNNVTVNLNGEASENKLTGLYLVDKDQHVDSRTVVNHNVPRCLSNQLYKGVLDDNGVAAFNGMVYVAKDAQKTEAFQTNRTLQLTDEAKIYTKPQLEIYADDVKCSHGATVGQPDTDQLFYMQARGIGEREAKLLQMFGFAHEVIQHIGIEPLRDRIDDLVNKRLRGELSRCNVCEMHCM